MFWHKDSRYKSGGYWHCAVKKRESDRLWKEANPEKLRESRRISDEKRAGSLKRILSQRMSDEKRAGSLKRILSDTATTHRAHEAMVAALPVITIGGSDGTEG